MAMTLVRTLAKASDIKNKFLFLSLNCLVQKYNNITYAFPIKAIAAIIIIMTPIKSSRFSMFFPRISIILNCSLYLFTNEIKLTVINAV